MAKKGTGFIKKMAHWGQIGGIVFSKGKSALNKRNINFNEENMTLKRRFMVLVEAQ